MYETTSSKLQLRDSVEKVPLIGPRNMALLERLEIRTVKDLLYHFPFRYEDFSKVRKIKDLIPEETVTVIGEISEVKNIFTKNGKNLVRAVLEDTNGKIQLIWFNQPYLARSIRVGDRVSISGVMTTFSGKSAFVSPEYEVLRDGTTAGIHTGRLVPVYSETAGVSSKWLRSRINCALGQLDMSTLTEPLPAEIKQQEGLLDLGMALRNIHFPSTPLEAETSQNRFAFEELFNLTITSALRKKQWQSEKLSQKLTYDEDKKDKLTEFIKSLPFELTNAQKKVTSEIIADLASERPMNRLLEGDVGSGKTVVAAIAAYLANLNGTSVLYMAPTEILANQHFETFRKMFLNAGFIISLITSSTNKIKKKSTQGASRAEHAQPLQNVKPTIFIGTHALLYQGNFDNVGLVIIDEQHRFGVEQRAQILAKASSNGVPHLLTMTATPIPRSLQLAIFGDLDLSILDEMPVGRKPVTTWVVPKSKRAASYEWLKKQQTQTFIVCPFIEESEADTLQSVKAATKEYDSLQKILAPMKLGLLHGRMATKDKEAVVENFRNGQLDVLVSTPVVEVGVDIPKASIMVIEGAERFGLASLHQLRGRVGRAGQEAFCLLFATDDDTANLERLKSLEKHHDGFTLAQIDLEYRGSGQLYGTAQHGLPQLKVANLSDVELMTNAKVWAEKVVENQDLYPEVSTLISDLTDRRVRPN